jgi:hypothetical protein
MKPRYSGKKSKRFWAKVKSIKNGASHDLVYRLGCELQNLESDVLKMLKAARKNSKK